MRRRSNGKEKDTKRKDPGDNGENEAMDNGEKKMQGRMVKSDTRVNAKNELATVVKKRQGTSETQTGDKGRNTARDKCENQRGGNGEKETRDND